MKIKFMNAAETKSLMKLFKLAPFAFKPSIGTRSVSIYEAIARGIVFINPSNELRQEIPAEIFEAAINLYGVNPEKFNQTFYKSFSTVVNADPMQLLVDQLAHSFTTYGAEALGVSMPTYVPTMALDIPEHDNIDFKFVVIRFESMAAIVEKINQYLKNLQAPNKMLLEDIKQLMPFATIATDDIKSFDLQVIQHDRLLTVPATAISQLRYMIYKATGQTLIIKNNQTINAIKVNASHNLSIHDILSCCDEIKLAEIFLRYKPLFLAFL